MRKGLMLLDVIILILAVALTAALVTPKLRVEKEAKIKELSRQRMLWLSEAEMNYFETAAGRITPEEIESLEALRGEKKKGAKSGEEEAPILRYFTDNVEDLIKFLPEDADTTDIGVDPLDSREFIIVARDSFFFSISSPNGFGQIILGNPTWEE